MRHAPKGVKIVGFLAALLLLAGGGYMLYTTQNSSDGGELCAQVITKATNPETGEVKEFPTPCDVPDGWTLTLGPKEGGMFSVGDETWERVRDDENGISFAARVDPDGYILIQPPKSEQDTSAFIKAYILFNRAEYEDAQGRENSEGPPFISILIFDNESGQSPREWAESNSGLANTALIQGEIADVALGEAEAIHYSADGLYMSENYIASHNDKLYFLIGSYATAEQKIREDFKTLIDTITFF